MRRILLLGSCASVILLADAMATCDIEAEVVVIEAGPEKAPIRSFAYDFCDILQPIPWEPVSTSDCFNEDQFKAHRGTIGHRLTALGYTIFGVKCSWR